MCGPHAVCLDVNVVCTFRKKINWRLISQNSIHEVMKFRAAPINIMIRNWPVLVLCLPFIKVLHVSRILDTEMYA